MSDQQQERVVKPPRLASPARPRQAQPVQGAPVDSEEAMRGLAQALGRVTVAYGPYEGEFDLAGKTVAYARENLTHVYNIDPQAMPVINGQPVQGQEVDRSLVVGERLEFMQDAGEKG